LIFYAIQKTFQGNHQHTRTKKNTLNATYGGKKPEKTETYLPRDFFNRLHHDCFLTIKSGTIPFALLLSHISFQTVTNSVAVQRKGQIPSEQQQV
jgi:hypothetical protein